MRAGRARWLWLVALLAAALACNFPTQPPTPLAFPSPAPGQPAASATVPFILPATPTVTSTPTPWPPPFFGTPGPTEVTPIPGALPVFSSPESITFLLIGSDRRTGTTRTDTLILANYQPEFRLVTLLSVPRDLYVYIPGWTMQRINAAYQHGEGNQHLYPEGGMGLLKDTILYNLGIRVDYTALIGFDGFIDLVDTLGGVDVPVACAYTDWHIIDPDGDAEDEDNWALYTVGPGVVSMDGDLALWYARSRLKSSDFDRGRRQQELLRALFDQALRFNTLARLPALYDQFRDTVQTDVSLDELLPLAAAAPGIGTAQVRSFYIDTTIVSGWRTPQNAAVLVPNPGQLEALLAEAMGPPDEAEQARTRTVVAVWNASGQPDWEELAVSRLNYAGFAAVAENNERGQVSRSVLEILSEAVNTDEALALAAVLGLSQDDIVHVPTPGYVSGYRVILGADYSPCFAPAKIDR
ncbi:MAG: LytR family transcriptional regulator [Anaerolineae bacterium]|nr:MAG: LytR family transcriptional regulator [Anaerolineae bacterium]